MPKQVDHQERRRLIADALLRVAAGNGLEAVSLRHVGAEAGVTSGMVQHYFRTKEEMLLFALEVVGERVQHRLAAEDHTTLAPAELARALLVQLLPLDAERYAEGRVALAFHAYAAVNPAIAAVLRENSAWLRSHLAELIGTAQARGHADAGIDPTSTATALQALVEGLNLHTLGKHYPPETALQVLDAQLDAVFHRGAAEVQ
ncbi:TetR family transcriptional regulator [Tamaricihabitans halophyticus]|uniref:TetR family transcriptional regulator n=1 Tax=Tamaricihabitans halophyticus TaxID=1262583 RepID=A0A4R2R104_9PSEU|nr:TetR/AcrR family transcriptional regulator [Tamaricihabitans halophyticus]TCP56163.1 TetR family transcriptional regulator [Tamaricihabitans halophyticus]